MYPHFKSLPKIVFLGMMSLLVPLECCLAADSVSVPAPALYGQLEVFHGHVCAGSLFGARLGYAARESLKAAGGKGKFTARYYDHSCPVDGIQVAAATTFGNKALTIEDGDEHRLVLTAEGNRRTVVATLTKKAEEAGMKSRDLGKQAKKLPAGSPERLQLERQVDDILNWLKTASTDEVVTLKHTTGKQ